MESYNIPLRSAEAEFLEKKSRFITNIAPVSSEDEARAFLSTIREKYREATHNVYAYRVMGYSESRKEADVYDRLAPGSVTAAKKPITNHGVCRHSDDGEPSGTAGVPLLDTFIKRDIYDFCCVATRYFGGILLGAGGLTRAYSRCGTLALEVSGLGIMREMALCAIKLQYAQYESAKRVLIAGGAVIQTEDFAAEIGVEFLLPKNRLPDLQQRITELTLGTSNVQINGSKMHVCKE